MGSAPTWGYSGSPLVVGDKIIFETGSASGSLICIDSKTGILNWQNGESETGYASPMLDYNKDILLFNEYGLAIHDFETEKF